MTPARQLLDERFARGEISAAEYQERMAVLNTMASGRVPPHRLVGFGEAVALGLRNYVNFNGRSSRAAHWFFALASVLAGFAAGMVDSAWFGGGLDDPQPVGNLVSILLLLPSLALGVRRLHDVNRSGWWLLLVLTVVGIIPVLFWLCQQGDRFANRFGEDAEAGR